MVTEIYEVMPQVFNFLVVTPRGKQYLFRVRRYKEYGDQWLWKSESGNTERLPKSVCQKMTSIVEAL